jgi:hypothetical protein
MGGRSALARGSLLSLIEGAVMLDDGGDTEIVRWSQRLNALGSAREVWEAHRRKCDRCRQKTRTSIRWANLCRPGRRLLAIVFKAWLDCEGRAG